MPHDEVQLTLSLDRRVWLKLYQITKEREDTWLAFLSRARLSRLEKAMGRRGRERWGGAREKLEAVLQ